MKQAPLDNIDLARFADQYPSEQHAELPVCQCDVEHLPSGIYSPR